MKWRRRNGWAILAEVCDRGLPSPWDQMIALGANLRVTNTALAGKILLIDADTLARIPAMRLDSEDATEYGIRVPRDGRYYIGMNW